MDSILCIDELSQKEESLMTKLDRSSSLTMHFFLLIRSIHAKRVCYRKMKKIFESEKYESDISKASLENMNKILDQLMLIKTKNIQAGDKVLSLAAKFYYRPFIKALIKKFNRENEFISEKIDDYKLALNNDFYTAIEKIIDGVDKSQLDIGKVRMFGSRI
jgi:hypothetical protein